MKMQDLHHRGGFRSANSRRPGSIAAIGRPCTTAHTTAYGTQPSKRELRDMLAEAARNTSNEAAE